MFKRFFKFLSSTFPARRETPVVQESVDLTGNGKALEKDAEDVIKRLNDAMTIATLTDATSRAKTLLGDGRLPASIRYELRSALNAAEARIDQEYKKRLKAEMNRHPKPPTNPQGGPGAKKKRAGVGDISEISTAEAEEQLAAIKSSKMLAKENSGQPMDDRPPKTTSSLRKDDGKASKSDSTPQPPGGKRS